MRNRSIGQVLDESSSQHNARGIALILVSMVAFALADTLVKVSSSFLTPPQMMLILLGGGLILFVLIAKLRGELVIPSNPLSPILLLRYGTEIIGMVGMVTALALVPISTVGAITQASPVVSAVGAVFFFGEKVSWRRWSAIALGFVGVVLVIQPTSSSFDLNVLWAVLALVALSIRDLTNRAAPRDIPSTMLATLTMIASIPFALAWVFYAGDDLIPQAANWWVISAMVALGSLGYLLLITSMRVAEIAVVTPFRYSRILFLLVLGVVVFGERPGTQVLLGAGLIIASGVYMMWRERRVRKMQQG